ncbi:MAG: DUF4147 domain-containing protein [Patescibacteria group bacterium]|nr:DUF4147 domain-containing protein [Patescibacteria group bacterium]
MKLPIIKNIKKLATNSLRQDALDILEAGYESVLTEKVMVDNIVLEGTTLKIKDKKYNLKKYKRIFVVAIGKCANQSVKILEDVLGDKITKGIVLDVESAEFKKMRSEVGTHPLPSEQNILVTKSILQLIKEVKKDDLVINVISGGGSALLCAPTEGIESEMLQEITQILMKKGATIEEMNIVRKHLSKIKGGQLAEMLYPAKLVSLIFSDVPKDNLSLIASGPTVKDESTKEDAQLILESYLGDGFDESDNYVSFLRETPKDEKYFEKVDNLLLVSNKIALETMQKKAEELGYEALVESCELEGEARVLGSSLGKQGISTKSFQVWGGETTVQIKGDGQGGRNQEFVLSALDGLPEDLLVMAAASDGRDNTDMAGALADGELLEKVKEEGIDIGEYLENNDSYNFFKKVGGQIKTGPTGINVADFYLILKR